MMKRKVEETVKIEEDLKKFRTDKPGPSKVLHLRSLPDEISELEIASIAIPFGLVSYMVLTRKNAQALIEMEDKDVAEAMFEYYQQHAPHLRNKRCFLNYSFHNSLQMSNSTMHPEAEHAVVTVNQMCEAMVNDPSGPVLRLIIDDWNQEKITSLHLYKIFQHYGTLEKIVVYMSKGLLQGFIQYSESFSAKVAKALTNNLFIFPRSCSMRVSFSNRNTLDISRQDEMIRDFVKHPVSPQELKMINVNVTKNSSKQAIEYDRSPCDPMEALAALEPLLTRAVNYPEDAMPFLRSLAPTIREILNNSQDHRNNSNYVDRPSGSNRLNFGERISRLLIVSNLNETKVTADGLFKLFGCYGDVTRVKIMYNRKNTALIQFACDDHAQRALQFLNGVNLYGKPIHANYSIHDKISYNRNLNSSIKVAEDANPDDCLHKDYSDHKLHRFRKAGSRNHVNVYEPNRVLHIAGLVDEVTEEDMEAIFQDHDFSAKKIKIISPNNKKMALVEMGSVESAAEALIALHDFDLCGSHLRVSFSKGPVN